MTNAQATHTPVFDTIAWSQTCTALSKEARQDAGGSFDMFVENVSWLVNKQLATLPEQHRGVAIEIAAADFNYETAEQLAERKNQSKAAGLCQHGFEPDHCPLGCGDL